MSFLGHRLAPGAPHREGRGSPEKHMERHRARERHTEGALQGREGFPGETQRNPPQGKGGVPRRDTGEPPAVEGRGSPERHRVSPRRGGEGFSGEKHREKPPGAEARCPTD